MSSLEESINELIDVFGERRSSFLTVEPTDLEMSDIEDAFQGIRLSDVNRFPPELFDALAFASPQGFPFVLAVSLKAMLLGDWQYLHPVVSQLQDDERWAVLTSKQQKFVMVLIERWAAKRQPIPKNTTVRGVTFNPSPIA